MSDLGGMARRKKAEATSDGAYGSGVPSATHTPLHRSLNLGPSAGCPLLVSAQGMSLSMPSSP